MVEPKKRSKGMKYKEYINSIAWKEKREDIIILRGGKCEDCGKVEVKNKLTPMLNKWNKLTMMETDEIDMNGLQIHHLNYNSIGCENYNYDVIVLCKKCHEKIHRRKF